ASATVLTDPQSIQSNCFFGAQQDDSSEDVGTAVSSLVGAAQQPELLRSLLATSASPQAISQAGPASWPRLGALLSRPEPV
ncbi:MAG: hypothetical protein AAF671_01150, partial [Pseudomonadota bacterium]